ncbi:hypothetical protein Hanom_Chr04g00321781 [Helianthus anomalus]
MLHHESGSFNHFGISNAFKEFGHPNHSNIVGQNPPMRDVLNPDPAADLGPQGTLVVATFDNMVL